jgi:antitoxin HigA-1
MIARHPGELLYAEWLGPLGISVTDAAEVLGVTRKTVSSLLNGRQGISAAMSVRLAMVLDVPEDEWLRRQVAYDLAHVDRRRIRVKRVKRTGGAK